MLLSIFLFWRYQKIESVLPQALIFVLIFFNFSFLVQLKGNEGAVNYYRLCFRLVSQQNLEFFKENHEWIQNADETFGGVKDFRGEPFLPEDYKSLLSLVRHVDSDTTGYNSIKWPTIVILNFTLFIKRGW